MIRDLGLVKGGKGMKHHEVLIDLSLRGISKAARDVLRNFVTEGFGRQSSFKGLMRLK